MVLVDSFCYFFSLSVGALIIGCLIMISSVVAVLYVMDVSDQKFFDFSKINLTEAAFGGVITTSVLFVIGAVIIVAWFWNKFKVIKWASLALLFCSIIRVSISIWKVLVGKDFGFFLFIFSLMMFHFYGFVVLWSFYQEERDIDIARNWPKFENPFRHKSHSQMEQQTR